MPCLLSRRWPTHRSYASTALKLDGAAAGEPAEDLPGRLRHERFGEEAGAVAEVAGVLLVADREPVDTLHVPAALVALELAEGALKLLLLSRLALGERVAGLSGLGGTAALGQPEGLAPVAVLDQDVAEVFDVGGEGLVLAGVGM